MHIAKKKYNVKIGVSVYIFFHQRKSNVIFWSFLDV